MSAKTYSMTQTAIPGDTSTGLDQLVDYIYADNGLAGANDAKDIAAGADAANRLNQIILEAAAATGAAADGQFTTSEVVAMNAYIRANRLADWTALHGDDEDNEETGYHRVQNDGSNLQYRGQNLLNTVADGIYHMGFEIQNGQFLNEDGNANASVEQVAKWLTQFYTDHSISGSGLDRITNLVMADAGLASKIPEADITGGADAADSLNRMILTAMQVTGANADGWVSTTELEAMNGWIRADANRLAMWTTLHGDDEKNEETGFHLVQNDGANTQYFGKNLVNTVADGIYHLGFEIQNGTLLNEDGNANAKLSDVADWINYFYADQSSTGTGLDKIVDIIKTDVGLARNTSAADINQGASYADQLNHFVIDAIQATGAMADNWITSEDMLAMNNWIRSDADRLAQWTALHGDDEDGEETGYHLVQNDGANTQYFGKNLVNTVADGIYHMGFAVQNGRFLNEDGNENAALGDVASWLNYFYKGAALVYGSNDADTIQSSGDAEDIEGLNGNDVISAGGGDDLVNGGYGDDTLKGEAGSDILVGGLGDDSLDGGSEGDTYDVTGNVAGGWASFNGYDTYADTGAAGTDTIKAIGAGNVDIGLKAFGPQSGIEAIDATGAAGLTRLLGNDSANILDFRNVALAGNILIDGGYGNDTLYGNADANTLAGGLGDDTLDGGGGGDGYQVGGNLAGGWASFNGYDTYADTGAAGTDTIKAICAGNVDIGLTGFGPQSGIEAIDATGAAGLTRLLGNDSANVLDFRNVALAGNILIDGGYGNDTIYGNNSANTLAGGKGDDLLNGGQGGDTYQFGRGLGKDSISDYDTTAGATDTLSIGAEVTESQLWFRKVGNDLEMRIIGTSDRATVKDWYLGEDYHIEEFKLADGSTLLDSQVDNLVNAMAAFAPPASGQTTLSQTYQNALNGVIAANWT
ncbi:MAG: calcium-binding protein [Candidatus Methylumidiphilus sp.]